MYIVQGKAYNRHIINTRCLINQLTLIQAVVCRLLTLFAFAASACNSLTDDIQEIPLGYVHVSFMYRRENSSTRSEKFVQSQGRENEKWC